MLSLYSRFAFRHYIQIAVMAALNLRGWAKRGRKRRGMR
jgi:hypothetical protein